MPWDPVRDLLTLQGRLESLFGHAAPGYWVPPVDLVEHDTAYVLTAEVPGMTREQIVLEVSDRDVTIRGTRPAETCCPERYDQLERGQGPFSRAFQLPGAIDADAVTAELADGILTVTLPKAPGSGRRIEVG
jgi:HSP20 family protein